MLTLYSREMEQYNFGVAVEELVFDLAGQWQNNAGKFFSWVTLCGQA